MKLVWNPWFLYTVSSRGCSVYHGVPTPWYLEKTMGLNHTCGYGVTTGTVWQVTGAVCEILPTVWPVWCPKNWSFIKIPHLTLQMILILCFLNLFYFLEYILFYFWIYFFFLNLVYFFLNLLFFFWIYFFFS